MIHRIPVKYSDVDRAHMWMGDELGWTNDQEYSIYMKKDHMEFLIPHHRRQEAMMFKLTWCCA